MKLAFLGDIALFGRMSVTSNPSILKRTEEIANYLQGFDFVVGNLETPFSIKKKTYGAKSAYICSDVENDIILKHLHINAVCLANNHMFDFGKEGYETTKRILSDNGINFFGAEGKEIRLEKDGNKLAFSGFCCYTSNPLQCVEYGEYGVNAYDLQSVRNVMERNSNDGYLNIVSVHAGIEHVNYPSLDHIKAARFLASICPFVYYGHHPHVIQGIEEYKGALIAHSLGNFCFDNVYTDKSSKPLVTLTSNNRTGAILEIEIDNNEIKGWKEQSIYIQEDGLITLLEETDSLEKYNKSLIYSMENEEEYKKNREIIINKRITERKIARDLQWYIKRLRPRYVKLIIDSRKNTKLFVESVQKYLYGL